MFTWITTEFVVLIHYSKRKYRIYIKTQLNSNILLLVNLTILTTDINSRVLGPIQFDNSSILSK